MSKTVIAVQGDTIDLICWRYYGQTSGVVEQVLIANPLLATQEAILEMGTRVILPNIEVQQQTKQSVNLWD
ncbi:tail protein X [Acinetobacter bereziniae]|uniref:tail protein X n=1 Tax=Acinetobacter bereziniae TaxID=106648 RepID=UPI0019012865|nr:tail protein X [Acinetobacter bereziniae]MBJ8475335.1 tail protein X [Acinetobacter bereziniae]MCU4317126.1 tail protein X [Acinetobacter bereziniae]